MSVATIASDSQSDACATVVIIASPNEPNAASRRLPGSGTLTDFNSPSTCGENAAQALKKEIVRRIYFVNSGDA